MRFAAAALVLSGITAAMGWVPELAASVGEASVPELAGMAEGAERVERVERVESAATTQPPAPLSDRLLTLDDGVSLAGALKPEALAGAEPLIIVDLRTAAEGTAEEEAAAAAAGHRYHPLPVPGAVVEAETLAALKQILEDPAREQPVVVHCASGNRAALLYGALALERGESYDSVVEKLDPILTRQGAIDALAAEAGKPGAKP
ncbi:MAG: sulfur transferase domain-containing protein [Pseudomonadota bacterium]